MQLLANTDYARYAWWLIALSLSELSSHELLIKIWVMTNAPLYVLYAPLDAIAALTTGLIICAIGVRHVRHLHNSRWLYGIVTLFCALAFYSRLLLFGNDPVSLWCTSLLIVFAYSLFFSQRLFPSKSLLNMALLIPVLALFTVPLQLASPETSATLIISGVLYALMHRHSTQKIPLYMPLLAFNGGVYLWIPSLFDSSQLLQIYIIPDTLSVLFLLHLYSREQALSKAIVLMVMGIIIISLMIWFNIKRTAILQRINALQAEMQTWE